MKPHLLPIRVTACAFDPATVAPHIRGTAGVTAEKPHDWGFRPPDYKGVMKELAPVWHKLFEPRHLPPSITANQPAICVSWAVPPGWGKPLRDDDPGAYPRLPDRWLVVRIARRTHEGGAWAQPDASDPSRAPAVKAWVVDAGVRGDPGGASVLLAEQGKLVAGQVGVVRTLDQARLPRPTESPEPIDIHGTAAGPDLTFSAFVPANLNNLSCIDVLDDLPAGQALADTALSYFVVGWYRQPKLHDPLVALKGRSTAEIRRALELFEPPKDPRNPAEVERVKQELARPLGERCVFHGLVAYVDYFNSKSYLGPAFGAPYAGDIINANLCQTLKYPERTLVGVGPTAEEALAELCARREDLPASESGEMAELLKALLDDSLRNWGVVGETDLKAHAKRLATFLSVPSGKRWSIGPAEGTPPPKEPLRLALPLRERLDALNAAQEQADRKSWEVAAAAESLYAVFWAARQHQSTGKTPTLVDYLSTHAKTLDALMKAQETLAGATRGLKEELDEQLADSASPVKLVASAHETPPFFVPKEPSVALRNISPKLPGRPLARLGRTQEQIGTEAPLDILGKGQQRLAVAAIASAIGTGLDDAYADDKELDATLALLAREAALVEEAVAARVRTQGPTIFGSASNMQEWVERGRKLHGDLGGAAIWPDPQFRPPSQDGSSLLHLANGAKGTVPLADLCTLWMQQPWLPVFLDWRVELQATGKATKTRLEGRTVLAHRPQRILGDRLARLKKSSLEHGAEVHRLTTSDKFTEIGQWDVVAQSLSGLHQQLLTRNDALPRIFPAADDPALGRCHNALKATSLGPPGAGTFQAVRDGALRIVELRVVDLFGQALVLSNATLNAERSVAADTVALDRRLLEPTRLRVQPGADAVRGWVVASRLDRAIVIYDGAGAPQGLVVREAATAAFRPLLGGHATTLDPALAAFVDAVKDAASFDQFMVMADSALARTLPARGQGVASPAALVGRPLALVRASIGFERRGGPMLDTNGLRSDYLFDKLVAQGPQRSPQKAGVTVGCRHLPEDGLICLQDGARLVWTAKLATGARLELELPGVAQPALKEVTFLLDPHGKVYVDPEVLPVVDFSLPPEQYEDVLARLPAVLRVDPVLVGSHTDLRAFLAPIVPGTNRPHLDLPLAAGRSAAPAARFAIAGVAIEVDPAAPAALVPNGEVAASDGVLIM